MNVVANRRGTDDEVKGTNGWPDGPGWPKDERKFKAAVAIVVGSDGVVYVSDRECIQCFYPSGVHKCVIYGSKRSTGLAIGPSNDTLLRRQLFDVHELYTCPPVVLQSVIAYLGDELLYVCDSDSSQVQVIHTNDQSVCRLIQMTGNLHACAISRKTGLLYVCDRDNIQVYDSRTGTYKRHLVSVPSVHSIDIRIDNSGAECIAAVSSGMGILHKLALDNTGLRMIHRSTVDFWFGR